MPAITPGRVSHTHYRLHCYEEQTEYGSQGSLRRLVHEVTNPLETRHKLSSSTREETKLDNFYLILE